MLLRACPQAVCMILPKKIAQNSRLTTTPMIEISQLNNTGTRIYENNNIYLFMPDASATSGQKNVGLFPRETRCQPFQPASWGRALWSKRHHRGGKKSQAEPWYISLLHGSWHFQAITCHRWHHDTYHAGQWKWVREMQHVGTWY